MVTSADVRYLEIVDINFGHFAGHAGAIHPGACAEVAFYKQFCAFTDIFFGGIGRRISHDKAMPFGAFGNVNAGCRAIATFGSGKRHLGNGRFSTYRISGSCPTLPTSITLFTLINKRISSQI